MATCLCDAFYADVAKATVQVLDYLGVDIAFPEGQTCCGQPAFNAGDWKAARKVARHTLQVFKDDRPVLLPSGSCVHMIHQYSIAFEKEPDREEALELGNRSWEFADYLVNGLGVESWPGRYPKRMSVHKSCHTRGSDSYAAGLKLLGMVEGVEVLPFDEMEQCCGFGGTFSVAFPNTSKKMGEQKLRMLRQNNPDEIAALDMACLMHLGGLADKQGDSIPRVHIAQVLRDALIDAGEIPVES